MKETLRPASSDTASETLPAPQGVGMAVAFDWGLVVQLLVGPFVPLLFGGSGLIRVLKLGPVAGAFAAFGLSLPFAALLATFGEGVRRGWKWTRPIQIGFNALGFLGGIVSLFSLWQSIKQGNYWLIVTAVILVIFSPLIAWRLSRSTTGKWFAAVKSDEARRRHGGFWIVGIALWSIVGGVLQAIAAFSR